MAKRKIERMIEDQDYPEDVARAVLSHAVTNRTVEDIEKGIKVLPHPEDAQRWYEASVAEEDRKRGEALRLKESFRTSPPAP